MNSYKLILSHASSERGADFGRPDVLPQDKNAPIKLRLEKLRWVDGDYDAGGAYWGNSRDAIYCAHNADGVRVFVRSTDRSVAKLRVIQELPQASFYDGPPLPLRSLAPGDTGREIEFTLHEPFKISARLCAALYVCGAWISLEYAGVTADNRTRYRWYIDLPDGSEHSAQDLKSGVGGGTLQQGFAALLDFLEVPGAGLFPSKVCKWAEQNADEISKLHTYVQETKGLIDERS